MGTNKYPKGLKAAFTGFVVALLGVSMGFGGFYVEQRWLSIIGFVTTAAGLAIGSSAIMYGWTMIWREYKWGILSQSIRAAHEMSIKVRNAWYRLWK
jgi:hypothetical protein